MFYRIKINLPKSRIKQYAEPLPISVSELNDNDFMALITKYSNHKDLANNISKLKFNGKPYNWSPSDRQIQYLTNFYLGNTIRLANEYEIPGNQFANIIDGSNIIHYYKNPNFKNRLLTAFSDLHINNNGRFVFRINNKNIEYTEPFNQEYISQPCRPEMFAEILRDIYKSRNTPLSRTQYETMGSSYVYNGILFKLPQKIDSKEKKEYNDQFKLVSQEFFPYIETEELSPEALKEFLKRFVNKTGEEYEYQRKKCPSYYDRGIETFYFNFENINYRLYELGRFIEKATPELKEVWKNFIDGRLSVNSIADQSLREIQEDNTLQWPDGIVFATQYDSSDFKSFAYAYLQKNNNDQIKTLIDAIKLKNDDDVLIDEENQIYYFNLSKDFFDMTSDLQKQHEKDITSKKEFQFKLFKNNNNWLCTINKVSKTKPIPQTVQLFQRRSDPNQYSLDAVLLTNGKISHIIEYDGRYHFGLRDETDIEGDVEINTNSFLNRMLADQLKSAFARNLNIPIIRVPDYNKYPKNQIWKDAFKKFILEKLNIIQTTPENINPGIREIPAYKIRQMIK